MFLGMHRPEGEIPENYPMACPHRGKPVIVFLSSPATALRVFYARPALALLLRQTGGDV